ncbi:hypothetical protein M7I_2944 [Glarea lozoyensis 74030]|uniref:Uncharacterized protein n=1 Tax=Glarea lozoyensis (strain ATCC 74030 / MF5533) TaxID=1104152 RepID=H0EK53_GLAL7|nr:hypothetical protein M7I_2944 [Glarea lozoyensis 74030]
MADSHEKLKATSIPNPLYHCPLANEPTPIPLNHRLIPSHRLPFPFTQLVIRGQRYGPSYGIPADALSRRHRPSSSPWTHTLSYSINSGHLLLRSTSSAFAAPGLPPSGQRNLLYCPAEDYTPYFSVLPLRIPNRAALHRGSRRARPEYAV